MSFGIGTDGLPELKLKLDSNASASSSILSNYQASDSSCAGVHQLPTPISSIHEKMGAEQNPELVKELSFKLNEAIESRDDANYALHRAQRMIVRLREEKEALLDRILQLETASGLTNARVDEAHQRAKASRQNDLLVSPALPSMQDKERKRPVLTTFTDFSKSTYNDPTDEAPRPTAFPPRRRSRHLSALMHAQKNRDERDANQSKPAFPIVAVLGLEGSIVAENVERAMAGEPFPSERSAKNPLKRKRESSTSSKTPNPPPATTAPAARRACEALPNPFTTVMPPVLALPTLPAPASQPSPITQPLSPLSSVTETPLKDPLLQLQSETAALSQESNTRHTKTLDRSTPVNDSHQESAAAFRSALSPDQSLASGDDDDDEEEVDDIGSYDASTDNKMPKSENAAVDAGKHAKPKKMSSHGLETGTYYISNITRNPDGTPKLPMMAGIIQIRSLGRVLLQDNFNTERYIFPVGFESSRKYPSMISKNVSVEYISRISNYGEGAPRFEILPSDQPGVIISAHTPTGAWGQVVRGVNKLRARNHSNSVSGPDYYGLSQTVVKAMIQELPHADQVHGYVWQHFLPESEAPPEVQLDGKRIVSKKIRGPKRRFKDPNRTEHVALKQATVHPNVPMVTRRYTPDSQDLHPDDLRVMDSTYAGGHDDDVVFGASEVDSSSGPNSPAFGGRDYTPSASLQSLMNPSSTSSNPYNIPVDPSLGAGAASRPVQTHYPYAIPPRTQAFSPAP